MSRKTIILLFVGFFAVLLTTTYAILRHSGATRAFVQQVMAKFIRGQFDLADADLDPTTGRVRLTGVRIAHPDPGEAPVLSAGNIELDVNTNPLDATGVGTLRQVHIEGLDLRLSLTESGELDWSDILQLPEETGGDGGYPAVSVTNSRVSLQLRPGSPELVFDAVSLQLLPDAADDQRMALSGSMSSAAGFEITVRGTADLARSEFRALLETADVPLSADTARPYHRALEQYLRRAGFTANADRISLWIQYPAEAGDDAAVTARLNADLTAVAITAPEVPYPIDGATAKLGATTAGGGAITFDAHARQGQGKLRVRGAVTDVLGDVPAFDVSVEAEQIPVDDTLQRSLGELAPVRRMWNAFSPRNGRIDAVLSLAASGGAPPAPSMDLVLHGVSGSFTGFEQSDGSAPLGFPFAIDDVRGSIHLRPSRVVIADLEGKRADGGTVHINGAIEGVDDAPDQRSMRLEIDGTGLAFSDELRTAVDTVLRGEGAAIYDRFSPQGRSDARVAIDVHSGTAPTEVHVTLQPLGCSVSYDAFPYRLEGITGSIEIGPDDLAFELSGQRAGAVVDIGGSYQLHSAEDGLRSRLWVTGDRIPLDDALHDAVTALSPDLGALWRDFDPRGTVRCAVTVWQPVGSDAYEHKLQLDFTDSSVLAPTFERRVDSLHGTAVVRGSGNDNHVDIRMLRGVLDTGEGTTAGVLLEGSIDSDPDDRALDLTTVLRDLPLNAALADTLVKTGLLDRETWDMLQPSGAIDLVSHFVKQAGSEATQNTVRIALRDVQTAAAFLPGPITALRGEVHFADGRGSFEDVRGRLDDAALLFTGGAFGSADGKSYIRTTLSADHLVVDDRFANLITGPLRQTFLDRRIRGPVRIDGLAMHYAFEEGGEDFTLEFDGEVMARGLEMRLVVPIRQLSGAVRLRDAKIMPTGGQVDADLQDVSFDLLGHPLRGFRASLRATPTQFALHRLIGNLHGGAVRGPTDDTPSLVYQLDEEALSASLEWDSVQLRDLMGDLGAAAPVARGTLAGRLQLERLVGTELIDMRATGDLQISHGRLGEVPIFSAIYAFLAPNNRPQFDGASLRYAIGDQRIQIDDLQVTSPQVKVVGAGNLTFDGYLDIDLEFPDLFAGTADWLILPRVVNLLTSQVVGFQVFGYLRSPEARPRWLFQGRPDRRRIDPIPAYTAPAKTKDF